MLRSSPIGSAPLEPEERSELTNYMCFRGIFLEPRDLLGSFGEVELPRLGCEFVIGPFKAFDAWLPLTIRFCVFAGADSF